MAQEIEALQTNILNIVLLCIFLVTYSKRAFNVWVENNVLGIYWFLPEGESPERLMMYYLNDGVYGSLNCFLTETNPAELKVYLHRVSINNLTMCDHCIYR